MPFRFHGSRVHLTYKGHIECDKLKSQYPKLEFYSCVHETSDSENEYEHTHFAAWFSKTVDTKNERYFDFEGIHPNIKSIKSDLQWRNTCKYHEKSPVLLVRTEKLEPASSLIKRIREAESLHEACESAGIKACTVNDVKLLRDDKPRAERTVSPHPNDSWLRPPTEDFKCLFIHGATNTGKTEWAIAHFPEGCLFVRHMDDLKGFVPGVHDGIVFDDMSFAHLPREAVIHLLDWDRPSAIHCRYTTATIPAHTRKIIVSNKQYNETFPEDEHGAIKRRISHTIHIPVPIFKPESKQPLE
jgi:hypothetical protein